MRPSRIFRKGPANFRAFVARTPNSKQLVKVVGNIGLKFRHFLCNRVWCWVPEVWARCAIPPALNRLGQKSCTSKQPYPLNVGINRVSLGRRPKCSPDGVLDQISPSKNQLGGTSRIPLSTHNSSADALRCPSSMRARSSGRMPSVCATSSTANSASSRRARMRLPMSIAARSGGSVPFTEAVQELSRRIKGYIPFMNMKRAWARQIRNGAPQASECKPLTFCYGLAVMILHGARSTSCAGRSSIDRTRALVGLDAIGVADLSTSELRQMLAVEADKARSKGDTELCIALIDQLYAVMDAKFPVRPEPTRH